MQGINKNWLPGKPRDLAAEAKSVVASEPTSRVAENIGHHGRVAIFDADKPICNSCGSVDRTPFNYGRCLPWKSRREANEPIPQSYLRTQMLRDAVAQRSTLLSHAEWELSQALRNVYTADTELEYELALARLDQVRAANDPLGIDSTFNAANMPDDAEPVKDAAGMGLEPTGDNGNGHVFYDGCGQ